MLIDLVVLFSLLLLVAAAAATGSVQAPPRGPTLLAAAQAFESTRYFSALDGLRAISVMGVVWVHVGGPGWATILGQGHKGVDLFFAISGFLVTTLLLREHRCRGRISLRDFYIRRTLRIFPLYYAVLALYCVLVLAVFRGTPKAAEFWGNLPAFLTYTSNWFVSADDPGGHGVTFYFAWSLATEEQFYLFWPALMVLVLWLTGRNWAPAVPAVLLVCIQMVAVRHVEPGLLLTILGSLAPAILFGVMFAVLLHNRVVFTALYPALGNRLMAPAAGLLVLACLQFEAVGLLTRFVMALLVASLCVRENTALHGMLRWRPLRVLGAISYGVYLMHMLAANAARKLLGAQFGPDVFVVTLAIVALMAYASHRWFESPLLRLKDQFKATTGRPVEASNRPADAT